MRRSSFASSVNHVVRAVERAQREAQRQQRLAAKDLERQVRLKQSMARQMVKEQKAVYLAMREYQTEQLNTEVQNTLEDLLGILPQALSSSAHFIDFESLQNHSEFPAFIQPSFPEMPTPDEPKREAFVKSSTPRWTERYLGLGKRARLSSIQREESAYAQALEDYSKAIESLQVTREMNCRIVEEAEQSHAEERKAFEAKRDDENRQIEAFRFGYLNGEQHSVELFCSMALDNSECSADLPCQYTMLYTAQSKELVIDYELPNLDVIPQYREYRFVKTKDEIRCTEFKSREKSDIYSRIIASEALRVLYVIFSADSVNLIESIVFNGFVKTTNLATGKEIHPCIITIQAVKDKFLEMDLSKIDVVVCIKNLRAHISPAISELAPVKPIVDLMMVDKRFISERDLISEIDDRTNLLEMNPFDFEHLICNLFSKIGLDAKLTRSSRDGGVDVIAYDPRPVFGGKYVIQAKRYRNTVEVSAVRDLYGTMMNENAAKGILVTTSTYGPDTRNFAKDKPIELIDGNNLLFMLEEQGVRAKIIQPD